VHGHALAAGTYQISIRTASGQVVRRATLVVVDGPAPSQDRLRSLRSANSCRGGTSAPTTSASAPTPRAELAPPASQQREAQALVPPSPRLHGLLGSSVAKTVRALRPLLVALLALAILLLGVASLPREALPDPRMNDLLSRHRIEVAGLGVAALVGVGLAFLLS